MIAIFFQSLTIILAPLYILRATIFLPTTLLEILIGLSFIATWYEFRKEKNLFKYLNTPFTWLISLFLLAALISVFFSRDPFSALGILRAYFLEPVVFYYCFILQTRKSGYKYIINSLIIAGIWLSGLALLQKITHQFTLAPHEIVQGRVSALYNSANALALFLGPITLLAFYLFIKDQRQRRFFYLGCFILFTLAVFWTKSRGGLSAEILALGIFGYGLWSLKNKFLKRVWLVVPIACFVLASLFLFFIYQSYKDTPIFFQQLQDNGDTLEIRYFLWAGTVSLLQEHPLVGAGLNGFKYLYESDYRVSGVFEVFQYPHNIFLTFWTEMGLVGLIAFCFLITEIYSQLIRHLPKSKYPLFGVALIAVQSYWLIHGTVDVPYFKNDLSLEFWVILALVENFLGDTKEYI